MKPPNEITLVEFFAEWKEKRWVWWAIVILVFIKLL